MKQSQHRQSVRRREIFAFIWLTLKSLLGLFKLAIIKPAQIPQISTAFSELYSKLWDYAEHSISHLGFNLPSALGNGPIHRVNRLLAELYGGGYASLSFGGSSGALLTLLTAVLPKLQPGRDLILFDDMCHQSTIGGIIFGRWKAVRLSRTLHPIHKTVRPLTLEDMRTAIETHGPKRFAAIILVLPTYDGFKSPNEDRKIYAYAKAHGIHVIVDGAWDALRFRQDIPTKQRLNDICDIWISSPHKRGLTPSSLGCIITQNETIARLWDEALDLGFRSSSVSFVEIMIAEHRLEHIVSGDWDRAFSSAEDSAEMLRSRMKDIHPDLYVIQPDDVQAELIVPGHILISTSRIAGLDARLWANILSTDFALDVEKSTPSTLLLLCASPAHARQIEKIILILKQALNMAISQSSNRELGEIKNG